jgi:hypothetical protein
MFRKIDTSRLRGVLATILLIACAAAGTPDAKAANPLESMDPGRICARLTETAEKLMRLPRMLLHSISLAESGRWNPNAQASFAWPWTVYAEGKGTYHPSREAALEAVEALREKGVKNIDVGCMQVNLMHHGGNFDSIEQALDPMHNVAYAARHLKNLRTARNSWATAVAHYHSATPALGQKYWKRVYTLWNEERRRGQGAVQILPGGNPLLGGHPFLPGLSGPRRAAGTAAQPVRLARLR